MKVFIIGGTGFLGWHSLRELVARGHSVSTLSLPPLPAEGLLPQGVTCSLGNAFTMPDAEFRSLVEGSDAILYAAGLDDRVILKKPAYPKFREANVEQCLRLLGLARAAGVGRALVFGSYFVHFDREWPELRLSERHCYIRSRVEQEEAVLAESGPDFKTMVFELPYIFGTMPGRTPLWTFLLDILREEFGRTVFYPKRRGGTAMVTVRQVAKAAAGALEHGRGGQAYAIGGTNMAWAEFIPLLLDAMGEDKKVVHLPKFLYELGNLSRERAFAREGKEGGLDLVRLADIMYRETYLDASGVMAELGYGEDDVRAAIRETVAACLAGRG
jgi:nucleoside-diphosphate-sugar epimerase